MNQALAVVSNVVRVKRDTVSDEFALALKQVLTRPNPAYYKMAAMVQNNPERYRYTKLPPEIISTYEEDGDTIYLPRGAIPILRELANSYNHKLDIRTQLSYGTNTYPSSSVSLSAAFQPFHYQSKGITELLTNTNGVVIAPCGAGKTVIGVAASLQLGLPTIVICHTKEIAQQWIDSYGMFANDLNFEIGRVYDGDDIRSRITVALTQTLSKWPVNQLQQFLASFGCVIIDECHHVPAKTFSYVVNSSSSMYRWGLTASKDRKDGLEFLMTDVIGPILYEVSDVDLVNAGRKQDPIIYMHKTTFDSVYDGNDYNNLLKEITEDGDRNRLIIEQVIADWNNGHLPIILTERTGHCRALKLALESRGMNIELLIGEIPKQRRKRSIEQARNNQLDGLIGTSVADEGLDIDTLSNLHLTCPSDNKTKIQQRVGRICRPVEGKISVVRDYYDPEVAYCMKKAKTRKGFYKRWGWEINEA